MGSGRSSLPEKTRDRFFIDVGGRPPWLLDGVSRSGNGGLKDGKGSGPGRWRIGRGIGR